MWLYTARTYLTIYSPSIKNKASKDRRKTCFTLHIYRTFYFQDTQLNCNTQHMMRIFAAKCPKQNRYIGWRNTFINEFYWSQFVFTLVARRNSGFSFIKYLYWIISLHIRFFCFVLFTNSLNTNTIQQFGAKNLLYNFSENKINIFMVTKKRKYTIPS